METNSPDSVSINMAVFDDSNKPVVVDVNNCTQTDNLGQEFLSTSHDSSGTRDPKAPRSDSQRSSVDIEEIELTDMRCRVEIDSNQCQLSGGDKQSPSKTRADIQLKELSINNEQRGNSEGFRSPVRQSNNLASPRRGVSLNEQPVSSESGILPSHAKQRSNPGSPHRAALMNDQVEASESVILLVPMRLSSSPGSPSRLISLNDQSESSESGIMLNPPTQRSSQASPQRTVSPNDRSKSTLSVPPQPWKRQTSPTKSKGKLRVGPAQDVDEYDDDDDEISMDSLLELLGTVRQYAKEIHEIYAPIKRDEEERIRKKDKQNAKRKSKDKGKNLVYRSNSEVTSQTKHEVSVEIHTPDNAPMEDFRQRCSWQSKQEVLSHSKSQEPLPINQIASLHVENERLASTWPRGGRRPTSRERFWSDTRASHQMSQKLPLSTPRPQIPSSWSGTIGIRKGGQILEKTRQTFLRPRPSSANNLKMVVLRPSTEPLGITQKRSDTSSLARPPQTMATKLAGDRRIVKQELPQISIIPASFDYKTPCSEFDGGSLPSALADNNTSTFRSYNRVGNSQYEDIIPPAPVVPGNDQDTRRLLDGDVGGKSTPRAGLRKRKSVDKATGHDLFLLEKY